MVKNKQDIFDETYIAMRDKHYSPEDSLKIAKTMYDEYREPEKAIGKKSFVLSGTSSGNIVDMVFGYPGSDIEEDLGVLKMNYDGWNKTPEKKIKGDMEHFGFDMASGVRNDLDEKWHNFSIEAEEWYIDSEGQLRAKVKFPDNELGKEALTMYNTGQLGASIEWEGYQQDNEVLDWEINSFSLTKDPSYNTKK